jgi:flagellar biosynthesis/type III secretory pathway M-ring protein FliF/YscJ
MTGSWRWNFGFGLFGSALTFLFSVGNNPLETTLLRCLYAFLAFTALAFGVRFVLGQLMRPAAAARPEKPAQEQADERGAVLDLVTPDDEASLTGLIKEQWSGGQEPAPAPAPSGEFKPLQPKRLVSLNNQGPEEVAQAIRRLTDEEGR